MSDKAFNKTSVAKTSTTQAVERFLPMNPVEFLVLAVLADGELHGYGLVQEIAQRTDGRVRPRAGNLYRVLDRLLGRGLVEEGEQREQRRCYRVTSLGRRVAAAEADLLTSVVARSKGLRFKEAS